MDRRARTPRPRPAPRAARSPCRAVPRRASSSPSRRAGAGLTPPRTQPPGMRERAVTAGMLDGMSLPAVIFDLDGTLVDSEPNYFEAGRRLLAEHGVHDFDWDQYARF